MAGFTLDQFGGTAPKLNARRLPPNMAQVAENVDLDSGILAPIKELASATLTVSSGTVSASTKTIYKYRDNLWIVDDEDVNFVRSPIAEDPHNRIYATGLGGSSGFPRMTTEALVANDTYYRLGLPEPADIATPTLSQTSLQDEEVPKSRSYIYTLVTVFGEEGSPNTPEVQDVIDVYSDQTVTVTFPALPSGDYNIVTRRLYRTDSEGTYRQVADIPTIGQNASNTYADTKTESELGEAIPTSGFVAPPDDVSADHPEGPMLGLTALPNGMLAGFAGRTVCFSESFIPSAFPDEYKLTVKSDIVSLAPLTNGVLVLTNEKPAVVSGSDPASMVLSEVDTTLSCESKRSVVDMGQAVLYASPDGIAMATESGINLVTEAIFTRDQWQNYNPSSMHAYFWEGRYVVFYSGGIGGASGGLIFDPRGGANSLISLDFYASAGYSDIETDQLYLLVNDNGYQIKRFSKGTTNKQFKWKSKKFHVRRPICPAVAKVDCDSYGSAGDVRFTIWADGQNKMQKDITSNDLFRLPSGYKANEFEVEIRSRVPVNEFCVYESAEEING